jgi:two-component system, chemotaxis family, chemotaxis protein CheY
MLCCLVVDDSDVIRRIARRIIEDMNYLVLEADSGRAALDQVQRAMPDIILLDWHMPGMSGHEFLAAFRALPAEHKAAVIYCTTQNDPADSALAYSGGAATIMLKPFDRAMLRAAITRTAVRAA